ncbi:Clavaminate synthase-like protein [Trichoderma citrinoviride]|uniref:Clavaminate synthase-like protein n=1 Tax=Trichoderma citrinoviride TaxID=58853 RepID=A0A2T4B8G3_9HYPO|nr:Clavaminate synthase-like protein [Trichoderma citrinoviride]PTB65511.1 Clavaminate synthase-like protein [Trichoderma citrinoviride]
MSPSMDNFHEIPIIDLSLADDPASLPAFLDALRFAVTQVGFLYVANHRVPPQVIRNLVEILPKLFELSESAKNRISLENSKHFLGYSSVGSETTAAKADQREQVDFATELTTWPSELPELRPIVEAYITELTLLGERFLSLVAQALDLPKEAFHPFLSDQNRLKVAHYPAVTPGSGVTQGVGPHTDSSGWWTFLLQASEKHVRGLQVLNNAGDWIDVPVIPDTFVVNVGQAFEVLTLGTCKATIHRVLSTCDERFSIPFFQGVRRNLTKREATESFRGHFSTFSLNQGHKSTIGRAIDSPFLQGKYDTWGESQLRTKIRSHRLNGQKFYPQVYNKYIEDDA